MLRQKLYYEFKQYQSRKHVHKILLKNILIFLLNGQLDISQFFMLYVYVCEYALFYTTHPVYKRCAACISVEKGQV